jgi:hypothetical protein
MKEVIFVDGRRILVDADTMMCPAGEVLLLKRNPESDGTKNSPPLNDVVRSYPAMEVKDVRDVKVTPVKEMAIKLLTACSKTEPHGSRKLAQIAGLEYSDIIVPILKKLREAGKVIFASGSGKWTRA